MSGSSPHQITQAPSAPTNVSWGNSFLPKSGFVGPSADSLREIVSQHQASGNRHESAVAQQALNRELGLHPLHQEFSQALNSGTVPTFGLGQIAVSAAAIPQKAVLGAFGTNLTELQNATAFMAGLELKGSMANDPGIATQYQVNRWFSDMATSVVADPLTYIGLAQISSPKATQGALRAANTSPAFATSREALHPAASVPRTASGAESAAQYARLKEFYRQSIEYGPAGVRQLESGRYRFYGELTPPHTPGEMAGARKVREWNPSTGNNRTWFETLDHSGMVRQVRPVTDGPKVHYFFDAEGNYGGTR